MILWHLFNTWSSWEVHSTQVSKVLILIFTFYQKTVHFENQYLNVHCQGIQLHKTYEQSDMLQFCQNYSIFLVPLGNCNIDSNII